MASTGVDDIERFGPVTKWFATLSFGVDLLAGGDALSESGRDHFIIDTWTSGFLPPKIYDAPIAKELREKGGASKVDAKGVQDFIREYELHSLPGLVSANLSSVHPGRRVYLENSTRALELMLRTLDGNCTNPSFDQKYGAVTGHRCELVDPTQKRAELQRALANAGYQVTPQRDLRETLLAWEKDRGYVGDTGKGIDGEVVKAEVLRNTERLLEITRERLFCQMDFGIPGHKPDLSDISFKGYEFKSLSGVDFSGSSIYRGGGEDDAKLAGLLEYNTDHPLTRPGIVHLASHEVMPGHWLNSAVADLLGRVGKLPFESTMNFMCAPSTVFQEGWADTALSTIYGSRRKAIEGVAKDFGLNPTDVEITLLCGDLQNIGKHNVSILYQREGRTLDEVKKYVAEDCVQRDSIVKKLSGGWAQHPIMGPMYGPAYHVGSEMVNSALRDVGSRRVAEIGLQTEGRLADVGTFVMQAYN